MLICHVHVDILHRGDHLVDIAVGVVGDDLVDAGDGLGGVADVEVGEAGLVILVDGLAILLLGGEAKLEEDVVVEGDCFVVAEVRHEAGVDLPQDPSPSDGAEHVAELVGGGGVGGRALVQQRQHRVEAHRREQEVGGAGLGLECNNFVIDFDVSIYIAFTIFAYY